MYLYCVYLYCVRVWGCASTLQVALCLDGYRFAIRLAGMFRQTVEREAFAASLTQFTMLGQTQAKEIKQKNVDAIKILLTIA